MSKFKSQIRMTLALGILSVPAGIFAHLTLTDIYHGETDLALEWNILRAGAVIIFAFVVSSLLTLKRVLKAF